MAVVVGSGGQALAEVNSVTFVDGHALRAQADAPSLRRAAGAVQAVDPGTAVGLRWRDPTVPITFDAAGLAPLAEAVAAVDAWNAAPSCSSFWFIASEAPDLAVGLDGVNAVVWHTESWPYDPAATAATTLFYVDDPASPDHGFILDADIELNAQHLDFTGDRPDTCRAVLGNVLAHELGHVIGLDHTCTTDAADRFDVHGLPVPACSDDLPPAIALSTMYPFQDCGETRKATPEKIDLAGVCALYPLEPIYPQPIDGWPGCTCAVGTAAGSLPAALALLALLARARRRRHSPGAISCGRAPRASSPAATSRPISSTAPSSPAPAPCTSSSRPAPQP